jgi:hypothetical protein
MCDVGLFQYATIQNYLTTVKHMHRAHGYQDPTKDDSFFKQVLRCVKRELGIAQKGAALIEPRHLHIVLEALDLNNVEDISFWVACLIGFFGLLRSGNVFVHDVFSPDKDLCLQDVRVYKYGYILSLKRTKIVQLRERKIEIVFPKVPGHPRSVSCVRYYPLN